MSKTTVLKAGHCYDVTEYVTKLSDEKKIIGLGDKGKCLYRHGYFVCFDVFDTHIYRVQVGINSKYETEPDTKIIEQYDIAHDELLEFCIENYNDKFINLYDRGGKEVLTAIEKNVSVKEYAGLLLDVFGLEEFLKIVVEFDAEIGFENTVTSEFRYDTPLDVLIRKIDGGYGITKVALSTGDNEGTTEG